MIDSFEKLSIGKFDEIVSIQESEMRPFDKTTAILSVLTDMSDTELEQMQIDEFARLAQKAKFLSSAPPQKVRSVGKTYMYGGMELAPTTEPTKMTAGQFVDFQAYVSQGEVDKVALMSVLLVPKGHKYNDGYDIDRVREAVRNEMTIPTYHALAGFFFDNCAKCIERSQLYLARMMEAYKWQIRIKTWKVAMRVRLLRMASRITSASGDGWRRLTAWLRGCAYRGRK